MDIIELLLGISPDGGSGSLEFLLLAVPIVVLVTRRVSARWLSSRRV
jgi:hypothetical protein